MVFRSFFFSRHFSNFHYVLIKRKIKFHVNEYKFVQKKCRPEIFPGPDSQYFEMRIYNRKLLHIVGCTPCAHMIKYQKVIMFGLGVMSFFMVPGSQVWCHHPLIILFKIIMIN